MDGDRPAGLWPHSFWSLARLRLSRRQMVDSMQPSSSRTVGERPHRVNPRRHDGTPAVRALAFLLLVTTVASCSSQASVSPTTALDPSSAPASAMSSFSMVAPSPLPSFAPVATTNCNTAIRFDHPPVRVVSADPRFTEVLLALGLKNDIVGTLPAYTSELQPDLRTAYAALPLIGEDSPTLENVTAASPDLIWASPFFFTEKSIGTRETWQAKGVETYVPAGSCRTSGSSINDTYTDILAMGSIFGVSPAAERLVDEIKASVAATYARVQNASPVKVFVYALLDPGNPPFTRGNLGIANDIIEQAGGVNVFAELTGFTQQIGWEEIVKADPDVIVVLDADDAAAKKSELLSNPIAATLRAVKQGRIVVVPIHSVSTPDLHNAEAVAALALGFHPEAFG